jgi:hypothetical protein
MLVCSSSAVLNVFHFFLLLLDVHVKTATPAKPSAQVRFFFTFSPSFELPMKYNQCFDPDPDWIRLESGQWIGCSEPGSGSRRAKMTHKNIYKKLSFEVLDVFFGGLKASSVAWTSFMEA